MFFSEKLDLSSNWTSYFSDVTRWYNGTLCFTSSSDGTDVPTCTLSLDISLVAFEKLHLVPLFHTINSKHQSRVQHYHIQAGITSVMNVVCIDFYLQNSFVEERLCFHYRVNSNAKLLKACFLEKLHGCSHWISSRLWMSCMLYLLPVFLSFFLS